MSTRGSCSTVSQSQLVRGPSVRAHSTTVSHRAARYSAGGPERDVWRGAEGRIAVARVLEVSAGGRVPPSSSAVCFAGPRPGAASVERRCGRLGFHTICPRQPGRRFSNLVTRPCTLVRGSRSPGDFARPAPPRRSRARQRAATRGPSRCRSDVLYKVYTHTRRRSFLSCVLNMSTQHSSSSRAQRVIAQLSQGRQSRI